MISSFAHNLALTTVDATNKHSVRSSKRTDGIHERIAQRIVELNPRLAYRLEHKLPTKLGPFDVDIVLFDKGVIVACILFKGLTSSIAKNKKNYEHNKIGEAVKAKSGMSKEAKLIYLDVIPVRCPTYKTDKTLPPKWETHAPETVRAETLRLIDVVNEDRMIPLIDDIYNVFVDYSYDPTGKVGLNSVVDASDLDRFDELIKSLAPAEDMSS